MVPSLDIKESILFYEKIGLRLIVRALPNYARFECPEGDATFSVYSVDKLPKGYGVVIYFECDDLDQYVAKLVGRGILFDELPDDKTWLWREARLKDPDHNQLILYHAGNNRKNPPWKIQTR